MNSEHNMDHLNHIEAVAASDCVVLRDKEATYQGSWKRAGGRSAWFMARRNIDRLLTMMAYVPMTVHPHDDIDTTKGTVTVPLKQLQRTLRSEDIFSMIEASPRGEDGTVLAVIRDLRRYMVLVEAEMVARGVVQQERQTSAPYQPPAHDVYQLIADEKGIPRDQVKDAIHALFYDDQRPGPLPPLNLLKRSGFGKDGVEITDGDNCTWTRPEDNVTICVTVTAVTHDGHPIISNTNMEPRVLNGWSTLRKDDHVIERRGPPTPRSPEAGSHHSSLYPWEVFGGAAIALRTRIGDELFNLFYNQRGTDHYQLEPVITNHNLPKELASVYSLAVSAPQSVWLLKRSMIPADLQDAYPRLQIEMNAFEYDTSKADYKFMYQHVGEKWILQQCYMEWAVQN